MATDYSPLIIADIITTENIIGTAEVKRLKFFLCVFYPLVRRTYFKKQAEARYLTQSTTELIPIMRKKGQSII